ncbi:DNA-binding protein RFXANK [Aspergillus nomiae NRRL 13137]|uniref:DNA-binding protein RFXANK n=1 Tax=Aspergillus nomiae NRRL (strain ATCC 15546 / NRRL 13137 / CBS 260.88 / M93) TaxID=1509407 RepID=A0A0L1JI73_ASPN3|nr:DNA-binding protein RFXANK [Aspergillus nomiae NRRL 13137]KNG91446.1 DNA-binding protein RFXANK [Aspergillus nomiae NRRL 13137]
MLCSLPQELILHVAGFLPSGSLAALIRTQTGIARLVTPCLYNKVVHEPLPLEPDDEPDSDVDDFRTISDTSEVEVPSLHWTECVSRWHSKIILGYLQSQSQDVLSGCGAPRSSLLHLAAQGGNIDVVKVLISKGIDIDRCHDGYSPLATAIQFSREQMALWLIGQGADVTEWLMGTGLTILNLAAGFCSATVVCKVVEVLREKVGTTGDIFSPSDNVMVLHRAIYRGDVESVRILLDNGADPSGWDIHGVSALTLATANGNEEIVTMLLDRDANPLPHDAVGRSALGCAAGSPKLSWTTVERIFHAYRNAGGDINCTYVTIPEFVGGAPRPLERLPLHQFAAAGSVPGVELLLQYGAQVSTKGRDGMTALHAALFSYRYRRDSDQIINEICRMLVEAAVGSGEDLNNQMTPYTSFMRMRGATALHLAVVCGLQEVVRLLLDHGADAKIVDEEGKTALDVARGLTDQLVIDLLTANHI